jgi:MFS family permease
MRKIAFVVAAASLFAVAPLANRVGPVGSSLVLVWLGVLLAVCASGTIDALAIAGGALGAFGSGVLASASPAVAGAVLALFAFGERTMRVRERTARGIHVLVALVGGGLAGSLSSAYSTANVPVFVVAIVVAGVLMSLPLLVDADDPVAYALDEAAAMVVDPAKGNLAEAAELRRRGDEVPLDRPTRVRVRTTWQSLLRLAHARVRLERTRPRALLPPASAEVTANPPAPAAADAVLGMIDQRIAEHVSALAKAYTAVDTVTAARLGVDDTALKNVAALGDSLEDVSRALVEVRSEEPVLSDTSAS